MRTTTMEIQRTADGLQLTCRVVERDYHIREEVTCSTLSQRKWVMDEFDTSAEDNNAAHIESSDHKTADEAIHEAFDRAEDILNATKRI